MKLLIGNFKGPKGEQGNEGKKGDNGDKGEKGERGSRWTSGTAITGTSTTETIFADSGITDAKIDDYYINTTTGNLYQCTASGAADTAKWVYIGNLKGPKGNDGPAGSISDINDQIPTYEESTQFENIESGEKVKIAFGKLKKALSVFIVHHTQKATAAILGHVKLSNSAAITKPGEYALDAIEKNATIEGTLAHLIDSQNNVFANQIAIISENVPFSFAITDDGQYGFRKIGADSVTPFLTPLNKTYINPSSYATLIPSYRMPAYNISADKVAIVMGNEVYERVLYMITAAGQVVRLSSDKVVTDASNKFIHLFENTGIFKVFALSPGSIQGLFTQDPSGESSRKYIHGIILSTHNTSMFFV